MFLWRINSHSSSFSKLNSTPNSSPIYPSEYTWFQIFSFVSLYKVIWLMNVYCWKSLDNCFPIKMPNLLMQARSWRKDFHLRLFEILISRSFLDRFEIQSYFPALLCRYLSWYGCYFLRTNSLQGKRMVTTVKGNVIIKQRR